MGRTRIMDSLLELCVTPYGKDGLRVDSVKDVKAYDFVKAMAEHLKNSGEFTVPAYVEFVKSAHYKELAPTDDDFIFKRAAAILRVLLIHPERDWGVGRLAKKFGGKKRAKGASRGHKASAAEGIIRHCVRELQKMGFLETTEFGVRK